MTDNKRFAKLQKVANKRADEITNILSEKGIWTEIYSVDVYSEVSYAVLVEIDGDWKHSHLYANRLIDAAYWDKGLIDISEIELENETYDSDDYKIIHSYKFKF